MKQVILTGDRPTGRLHIGHYVGSLRERVYELEERLDAAIRYAETAPSEAGMARTETADAPSASDTDAGK